MQRFFLLIVFALLIQSCFTKRTQVMTNQSTVSNSEQMYAGHTALKPEEVPQSAISSWKKNYSEIKGDEWYKTSYGYIVYYVQKKRQSRIGYDTNGKVVLRSREVKSEDVPLFIRDYMKQKYPGIQYGRTYLTTLETGEKRYDVQVGDKWERFDINGKSLGKNDE